MLLLLLACAAHPPAAAPLERPYLRLTLTARQTLEERAATAWTAQLIRLETAVSEPSLVAGQCRPQVSQEVDSASIWASSAELSLPLPLVWDQGVWRSAGPLLGQDPAWTSVDFSWHDSSLHKAQGAVRFSDAPVIDSVKRVPDGGVFLKWKNSQNAKILSVAEDTGVAVVCGTMRDGAYLPRWAAPEGAKVVLQTTRVYTSEVDGILVVGEAVLEQVIELDKPLPEPPATVPPVRQQLPDSHQDLGLLKRKREYRG